MNWPTLAAPWQLPSAFTVTFWHTGTGGWLQPLPSTVTVVAQVLLLPFTSVTVTTTGMVWPACAQLNAFGVTAVVATAQLSENVATWPGVTVTVVPVAGDTVMAEQTATGASLSVTVKTKEQDAVLPEPSVTTNVLVVAPTGNTEPDGRPLVWTKVTPPQLSATSLSYSYNAPQAPGSVSTELSLSFRLDLPAELSPWPARLGAPPTMPQLMVGGVRSCTVMVNEQAAVLPVRSTAVKLTVEVPFARLEPLAGPEVCTTETVPQLSVAVALAKVTGPGQGRETDAGQVIAGGVTSETVTGNVQAAVLPLPSVAVKVTPVVPPGKTEPLAGPAVRTTVTLPQLSVAVALA